MVNSPRISIIVPTFNRAQYLDELIASFEGQSFSDFEICIIDDGSTDNTKETVLRLQEKISKIRLFSLGENKGATFARNFGIEKAQGDWIMLWDSDDILYPHALETLVAYQQEMPQVDIFSAPAQAIKKGKEVAFPERVEGFVTYEDILARRLPQNSKIRIAKKHIMQQVRYVSKNIDFLVNVQLVSLGKWFHISKTLGLLRIEDDGMSLTSHRKKKVAALSIERAVILDLFLREHGEALLRESPALFGAYAYGVSIGQLLAGNYESARMRARQSVGIKKTLRGGMVYVLSYLPFGQNILHFLLRCGFK